MSNIPQARAVLKTVAQNLKSGGMTKAEAATAIRSTMRLLTRKSPVRRAPRAKRYVTRRLAGEIRAFARQNPSMHMQDIAAHFGVNIGRVSEVLSGLR